MKINIPEELQNMMPKKNGPDPSIDEETRQKQDEKKKKNRNRALAVLGILILIFIFTNAATGCLYRVDEQEAAVVTMFGNVIRTDTAGLYFKIPLIQQVRKVDTTIHGTGIGYAIEGDGQTFTVDTEGIMITSDFNLIDIDFYMEYRVSDPIAYLYNSGQPELILKNIALAAIRSRPLDRQYHGTGCGAAHPGDRRRIQSGRDSEAGQGYSHQQRQQIQE